MREIEMIDGSETMPTVDRTFAGLREALFDEINALRGNRTTIKRARTIASLARQAIDSVAVEFMVNKPEWKQLNGTEDEKGNVQV